MDANEMTETAEIAEEETNTQLSPISMVTQVYNKQGSIEGLREILELQIQWEKNEARKAYHSAMAKFKANAPEIMKDKKVQAGQAKYSHASLWNVTKTINESLSKFGLSISWNTSQNNGLISVTCKITHVLGHSEECTLSAAADNSGAKNSIQAIGSTVAYLQRYTALAVTGLATSDMDDDGASATEELISAEQGEGLAQRIVAEKIDLAQFCKYMKVDSIPTIKKADYQKAINVIEAKKAAKK